MARDLFGELREAIRHYYDWPDTTKAAHVIDAARTFVSAVEGQAAMIKQMRAYVTPTQEALSGLIKTSLADSENVPGGPYGG